MRCKLIALLAALSFQFLSAGITDHYRPIEFKGGSKGPSGIDYVYMINLEQRPERWKKATSLLAEYQIYPQRFPGIYGWTIPPAVLNDISLPFQHGMYTGKEYVMHFSPEGNGDYELFWLNGSHYGKGVFSQWTVKGTIGCSLSHLSILQDALESEYERIWILEDDIAIIDDPHKLTDRIQELDALVGPDGWDVLYTDLDYLIVDELRDILDQMPMMWRPDMQDLDLKFLAKRRDLSCELMQIGSRMRAHSIIYSKSGIHKILDFYKEHQNFLPYDQELPLVPGIRLFVVKNSIVSVQEETTDTRYHNFQ